MKMMDKLKKRSGTVEAVILILISWSILFFLCGENPVQVVGYIMSGDPTYITSHKSARSLIMKVDRDELVEELLTKYIEAKHWK